MRLPLLILFLLISVIVVPAQGLNTSSGHIKGTVFDWTGAVVPFIKVVFENGGQKKEFSPNGDGAYEGSLSPGIYRVTTAMAAGFCPTVRAPFRVQKSSNIVMNLRMVVCGIGLVDVSDKNGKHLRTEDRIMNPFQSESFRITNSQLDLMVRYGKREEKKGVIEYVGPSTGNQVSRDVTVTYDVITIIADKIRLNKKTLMLEADGNVHVEDGKLVREFDHAQINFKTSNLITTLKGK